MTMQQVMPMNDLYSQSNLDGSTNCFGHSCATRVARTEVTPISYPVPCTVASGFYLAQYAANNYSQMNDFASTNVPLDNAQAYSTTSQNFLYCSIFIARKLFLSFEHTIYATHHIIL
jgi:hypothetical protein